MELSSRLIQENILLAKMEFSQGHLCFFDIYGDCVDCLMGKHNRGVQIKRAKGGEIRFVHIKSRR
ncbi:hypothetical protein CLOLEP_00246 [[Clostridium] leptum DSM 753]|uniref:Uncharacterized protein n=1 Tax=[Clostridium] leptum DSM 753 TaxID=428125 RepID=A7VNX0_9FIRM|nr:hypothetical protein CLOLEP_00246 [[Clostridium] leptum DSM 753]